jgi:hypothetical protein
MMPITIPSSIATITLMSKQETTNGKDSAWLPADLSKDSEKEIARLASLSKLKYAEQRAVAAEDLGIGLLALDGAVREERRATSVGGQGQPLQLNQHRGKHP